MTLKLTLPLMLMTILTACSPQPDIAVVAHRGASGYLPEHTIESTVLAYGMKPDFIEQDVVISKDNRAVVLHDLYLDAVTDVAVVFPVRARNDGKFYAVDFTLEELKRLKVHDRKETDTGRQRFAGRFPLDNPYAFRIASLEETIELIQGLNKSTGQNIGIYPELKSPRFHRDEGKDIAIIVLDILKKYGYTDRDSGCILQCFDPETLKRVRHELKSKLFLVQLIAENAWNETPGVDYTLMQTREGIKEIATYADGIGPWLNHVIRDDEKGGYSITSLIKTAHAYGMKVHPYTHRTDLLPGFVKNEKTYLDLIFKKAKADGIFTDFPDLVVNYVGR